MENDSISSSSSESKLPLIVGVLGFILGAVALIFAIKAKSGAEAAAALANDSKQLADAVSNIFFAVAGNGTTLIKRYYRRLEKCLLLRRRHIFALRREYLWLPIKSFWKISAVVR